MLPALTSFHPLKLKCLQQQSAMYYNPKSKMKITDKSLKMEKKVNYWLLKTEPAEWSWDDQAANGGLSNWDGVKNKQAQKYMKSMKTGDLCFFYHSGTKSRRVVGVVEVVREWYEEGEAVDVKAVGEMKTAVGLAEMKKELKGVEFALFKQPRLSVLPVEQGVWKRVCEMGGGYGDDEC